MHLSAQLGLDDKSLIYWLSGILARIASPTLANVSICVEIMFYRQLMRVDWQSIDMYLSRSCLEGLKRVEFCVLGRCVRRGGECIDPDVAKAIMLQFPQLSKRGILVVMQRWIY